MLVPNLCISEFPDTRISITQRYNLKAKETIFGLPKTSGRRNLEGSKPGNPGRNPGESDTNSTGTPERGSRMEQV